MELCLANPDLIATAKCKLPLEACLANPEYIALPGCLGNAFSVGMAHIGYNHIVGQQIFLFYPH